MTDLQDALTETLEPLVRRLVREEVERARMQWRWQSVDQAARSLDMSKAAIYSRVHRNQLPAKRLDGRLYIDMEALDRQIGQLP